MADVVVLKTTRERNQASVIETLEDALAEAKAGQIVACGVCVVRPNGAANASFSDSDVAAGMLGAAALLQHRILQQLDND